MSTPVIRLAALFESLLSENELRRFVTSLPAGEELSRSLPGQGVSLTTLSFEAALLLKRRGLVNEALFRSLAWYDGERAARVIEVAASWDVILTVDAGPPLVPLSPTKGPPPADGLRGISSDHSTLARSRTGAGWDVFLAHASPDKRHARDLYGTLSSQVRTFLDEASVPVGTPWDRAIQDALWSSAIIVVLVSGAAEDAYYLREEIASAIARARKEGPWTRVLPLHLNGSPAAGTRLPYGIALTQGLAVGPDGLPAAANRIVGVVDELARLRNLALLFERLFVDGMALDGWLRTLPKAHPMDEPYGLVNPMLEGAREAVGVLVGAGRVDTTLFDLLLDVHPGAAEMIGFVRQQWHA